ncbi:MAG: ABC transporter ATP-binding protein [Bacteroidetes bacterium 46-16]|nr:MAG: ABC transporter ATP-binding protein [Bacteroidetes bacterium 46-16]
MDTADRIAEKPVSEPQRTAVLEIKQLKKAFGSNVVLDDFNLAVYRDENVVVLGRSGSGKSVLIKCIIGLLKPDLGSINVLGEDVLALDHDGLDHIRMRIGFLFQSNALYDSMTVRENLEFPMRRHLKNMNTDEVNERVNEMLSNVGLLHTIDMMPSELSGGMQKRIALARTLILKPEIILYDEPTTGLDPVTGREISTLMVEMQEKYKTSSIIISHDMKCVKATADRVVVLVDGKAHAIGSYADIRQSADERVKQFFE